MSFRIFSVFGAAALLFAAAPVVAQAGVLWDGSSWLVEDIGGRGMIDYAHTTLRIDRDGRASGSAGRNRFAGKATGGEMLRFGSRAMTYCACPPALADQERRFLLALKEARGACLDRLGRFSSSAASEALLTFAKISPWPKSCRRWLPG